MPPSVFDLEVWADYQMSEVRRARQHADLPVPPSRVRTALGRTLIALGHRLWQPEPDAAALQPVHQPS